MMRKLFIILILCITAQADTTNKPMLGEYVDWFHPLAPRVGIWFFNEGSGDTVQDLSGNGNTGVYTGVPDWGVGKYGANVRHDDDQYITFAKDLDEFVTNQFTVIWIGSPTQITAGIRRYFCGQYQPDGASYDWGLYLNADGTVAVYVNEWSDTKTTSALSVGTTNCIALSWDGATVTVWFDGDPQDSVALADATLESMYDFRLGDVYNTTNYADVKTEALYCYNRALTASEIQQVCQMPFCFMVEELPVAMMYVDAGAPAPTGRPIMIQMGAATLGMALAAGSLILMNRKKAA